jgi:hypothetical protein
MTRPPPSRQASSPPLRPTADALVPELKHLTRTLCAAGVSTMAILLMLLAMLYRAETRAQHSDERSARLKAAQEKSARVLSQVVHAVESAAAARAAESHQVASVPPRRGLSSRGCWAG